jgi:P-type conjugative transfer protein TrbJ
MTSRLVGSLLAGLLAGALAAPAHAQFGIGDVVIDPVNLVQNTYTAARTLEQLNNQIRQLQNEAQMLVNQAENLKRLDYTSTEHLKRLLERTETLMRRAEEITYEIEQSEDAYASRFPEDYQALSRNQVVEAARAQWQTSRAGFSDTVLVQSGIVTAIVEARATLTGLMGASETATGNLAAAQAGNQLIALSVEQQMQMQQLMAAQYRAETLEAARRAAIEDQARSLHRHFMGTRRAYEPD